MTRTSSSISATKDGFDALPAKVRRILNDPDVELLLSVASEIEVAIKSRIGKLALAKDELTAICANASIASYPLRQHHVDTLRAVEMNDLPVISCDKQFRKYKGTRVIW